jgi:hypothetical protein
MKTNKKIWLYLDDVRTPKDDNWQVVRNYDEFVAHIKMNGLDNYEIISLDHDLGDTAMREYYNNVSPNYTLDYNNIQEKTGLHCAKWLVNEFYNINPKWSKLARDVKKGKPFPFPKVYVHSANPIGSANMMGYINNFFMNEAQAQTCVRVNIEHTI